MHGALAHVTAVGSIGVATAWGALAGSGVLVGALLGVFARLTHGAIARIMAVGAGLLLAAATVELAAEVVEVEPYEGMLVLLLGAASFSTGNAWLSRRGAQHRKRCGGCVAQPSEAEMPNSGLAIAMGTAMDAVPEALVLGLVLHAHGPDAALIAAMLTGAGFALAGGLTEDTALLLQAFGAGALLAMVSETLLPEAAHEGPGYSGLVTAIGFALPLLVSVWLLNATRFASHGPGICPPVLSAEY